MTLFHAFLLILAVLAILGAILWIRRAYYPRVSYEPKLMKIVPLPRKK